jgi:probable F420-dependent oxidoreductase
MRVGVGFPGCREGTAYPVGFVRPQELATVARRAEELGYYSIWSNDHLTTPRGVSATQAETPNFYEPLVTYSSLVNLTRSLRLMLAVITLPQRDVVLLAKQVATLDRLAGGRVMLGVGLGAYREEFEAVHPGLRGAHRGTMLEEGIEGLRRLFEEERASYEGRYVRFAGVELAPKPVQRPFPIYVTAHAASGLERVGRFGDGLIVAARSPDQVRRQWDAVRAAAAAHGRDPASLSLHVQTWLALGETARQAEQKALRSQHFRRMAAQRAAARTASSSDTRSASPGEDVQKGDETALLAEFRAGNLLGTPADVAAQVRAFRAAGTAHLGVIVLAETMDELLADMELFAARVVPAID